MQGLGLEQGGFNIYRRFRITELETAEVPATLQHTLSGHAKSHVSEAYKKLLKQRAWRLRWAEKAGTGFALPGHQQAAAENSKWQVRQDFGIPKSRLSPLNLVHRRVSQRVCFDTVAKGPSVNCVPSQFDSGEGIACPCSSGG